MDANKKKVKAKIEKMNEKIPEKDVGINHSLKNVFVKKETMEETHLRVTFLIRKELVKEYNQLLKKNGRNSKGVKTRWINNVLERAIVELKEYENSKA